MDGGALDQPGATVDAATFIPPALLGFGVYAHSNGVDVVAIVGDRRKVDLKGRVTAIIPLNEETVNPNSCMGGNPVKLEFKVLAAVGIIEPEVAAIPSNAPGSVTLGNVGFPLEGALHNPIVRKVENSPITVIEIGRGGSPGPAGFGIRISGTMALDDGHGNIAKVKTPTRVE
jgi:hypothetical protein